MEGSYSKVWRLCSPSTSPHSTQNSNLPRSEFSFFVKKLVETVRGEIANCHERAYTSLEINDAKTLLFFDNEKEVREFSKEVSFYFYSLEFSLIWFFEGNYSICFTWIFSTISLEDTDWAFLFIIEQRNWYIDASSTVHFPSSPSHPSALINNSASANNGVPKTLAAGGSLAGGEDKEMNKERVITATLNYAKELESVV